MLFVKPAGICCTKTTGAKSSAGRNGITLCSAFGPPVDDAIATILLLPAALCLFTIAPAFFSTTVRLREAL